MSLMSVIGMLLIIGFVFLLMIAISGPDDRL